MANDELKHTGLTVNQRNLLTLDGVLNVESFDEQYLSLELNEGRIFVEGQGLKIESLSRDGGEIRVSGRINGLYYSEKKSVKSKLSKLFG